MAIRVAHVGTGNVGRLALTGLLTNPAYELTGVCVSSDAKVGKDAAELFAYATGPQRDDTTVLLQAAMSHWRTLPYATDEQLEAAILGDGIDILIDLSGHTGRNRLLVFARKPAPVISVKRNPSEAPCRRP